MLIKDLQRKFILNGALISPILPLLYLQGQYTRWKVGRLPDAEGETSGLVKGTDDEALDFLAIGESTIAGVGARDHSEALTGQFAKHLSHHLGKGIRWHALGVSGITIHRALDELIPKIPEGRMDYILIALGGNDVFKLSTPEKWRDGLKKMIGILREKYPESIIFLANVPMVRDFISLPNPTRYILSRLAKMHHFNSIDLISGYSRVYYYLPQGKFREEHFSDGVHPSPEGYDLWAKEMIDFFSRENAI